MKILIGDVVLAGGEEVNQSPYDISILSERDVQTVKTLRGINAKSYDRGNQVTTFDFKVTRKHDSIEAAQEFILGHAANLYELESFLTVIEEPSEKTFYLLNAVVSSVYSTITVNTTTHFYHILGGQFSTSIE